MSKAMTIFIEKTLNNEEFSKFIKLLNGYVIETNNTKVGVIEKEEATIWINSIKAVDESFYMEELNEIKELYNFKPLYTLQLEIGSYNESGCLAYIFCKEFLELFPSAIIDDRNETYYSINDLKKLKSKLCPNF